MVSTEDYESSSSSDNAVLRRSCKRKRLLSGSVESSSSSLSDMIRASTLRRCRIESGSDSEIEEDNHNEDGIQEEFDTNWCVPVGNQARITFSNSTGINMCQTEIFDCTEPHSFYSLFVTDEIFEMIANETNIYASQRKCEQQSYRLHQWYETNSNEIKRFFGLIMWMGLVRLPKIDLYWSKYEGFNLPFARKVMSRNRFEILLRFIHFNNNEDCNSSDRLYKIVPIINYLNINFKKYYNPDEILCVDESLVPFRGRIIFRQYIKQKRHRYGVKIFKLCSGPGYTHSFQIYEGKDKNAKQTSRNKSSEVVLSLCKEVLGKGHTICTDNYYTSVELAEKLTSMQTHLVGTLRKSRRGNPKEVVSQKLKRGQVIARENEKGITVLKWKDKRDVLMLSTKHSAEMISVPKRSCSYEKPKMVVDYNLGKSSVDLSDQMSAYSSPLRKTIKWYRKLAIELLLNTCVVNSLVLYKQVTQKNISITDFRMKLVMYLVKCSDDEYCTSPSNYVQKKPRHELKRKSGSMRSIRRFCKLCYEKNSKQLGRTRAKNTTKKVATYCADCSDSPFLCLPCFNVTHRYANK